MAIEIQTPESATPIIVDIGGLLGPTVDAAVIAGSANAVSGNAVFDALASKSNAGHSHDYMELGGEYIALTKYIGLGSTLYTRSATLTFDETLENWEEGVHGAFLFPKSSGYIAVTPNADGSVPPPPLTDNAAANPGVAIKSSVSGGVTFGSYLRVIGNNISSYVQAENAQFPDSAAALACDGAGRASIAIGSNATGWAEIYADNVTAYIELQLPSGSGTLARLSDIPPISSATAAILTALGIPSYSNLAAANTALASGSPFYNSALTKLDITTA